jgi:uncharacterized protein YecE (DUF72 family)
LAELRIGTSGWIYKHWKGLYYPEKLPQKEWWAFYAREFDTVEINYSFYRLPTREAFEAWRDQAGPDFRYAVKGSRFITHMKRLGEAEKHVGLFFERVRGLGDRAGPILWQLPPHFRRNVGRLDGFLAALPRDYQHAIEFRHESWLTEEVFGRLEEREIALCIPESPKLPKAVRLTADWTYLRFHEGAAGGDYTATQLDEWAAQIRSIRDRGADVWAYFNNDWEGYALANARALREKLADK